MNDPQLILKSAVIVAIILAMLGLERLIVIKATKSEWGKSLIARCPLLHPNGISLIRFPQGVIAILFAYYGHWCLAILWFAFWMITDLSDGTIARNCNLVSETGKWLDPLSDKMMHFPALLFMAFSSDVKIFQNTPAVQLFQILAITYCVVDALGQASRLISVKKAANSFGKAKTALMTILISVIAIYQISPLSFIGARLMCVFMVFCLILASLSFYCKIIPDNWYANSLTTLNLLCGLGSIALIWFGTKGSNPDDVNPYIMAFLLIFLGQFFDLFDGRMARKYGSTSWGPLYDDIADATSFGFAIACLIFKTLVYVDYHVNIWIALAVSLVYLVCLLYRLYRFLHPNRIMPPGIFQGMPAPAGAILAGSAVLLNIRFNFPYGNCFNIFLVILAALLMVSNIPYRHFGQDFWPKQSKSLKLFLLLGVLIFVSFAIVKYDCGVALIWLCAFMSALYAIIGISRKKID